MENYQHHLVHDPQKIYKHFVGTSYNDDRRQPILHTASNERLGDGLGTRLVVTCMYTCKDMCAHQGTLKVLKCHHGECHLVHVGIT